MTQKLTRGFQILSKFKNSTDKPQIPQRATTGSAGYDIRANETIVVPSITRQLMMYSITNASQKEDAVKPVEENLTGSKNDKITSVLKPTMVHTGIKAYMPKDEVLYIYNRSSNPGKRGLYLANGVGVVDSDYFDNPSNEGELLMAFINLSANDYTIHKGDRIAQGVFAPYLTTDNDHPVAEKRSGGFGSTGK